MYISTIKALARLDKIKIILADLSLLDRFPLALWFAELMRENKSAFTAGGWSGEPTELRSLRKRLLSFRWASQSLFSTDFFNAKSKSFEMTVSHLARYLHSRSDTDETPLSSDIVDHILNEQKIKIPPGKLFFFHSSLDLLFDRLNQSKTILAVRFKGARSSSFRSGVQTSKS